MGVPFTADEKLADFLTMIGLVRRDSASEDYQYYVHQGTGNQVRLNDYSGEISFLDKYGYTGSSERLKTSQEIESFVNDKNAYFRSI